MKIKDEIKSMNYNQRLNLKHKIKSFLLHDVVMIVIALAAFAIMIILGGLYE